MARRGCIGYHTPKRMGCVYARRVGFEGDLPRIGQKVPVFAVEDFPEPSRIRTHNGQSAVCRMLNQPPGPPSFPLLSYPQILQPPFLCPGKIGSFCSDIGNGTELPPYRFALSLCLSGVPGVSDWFHVVSGVVQCGFNNRRKFCSGSALGVCTVCIMGSIGRTDTVLGYRPLSPLSILGLWWIGRRRGGGASWGFLGSWSDCRVTFYFRVLP